MFYDSWMSYIKDDVKLRDVVIPGTHDSGTHNMPFIACCQDGSFYEQYLYGSRYFDTRFHISKSGKPVFEHGVLSGMPLEEGLRDISRMLKNNDSEFFIFKIWYFTEQALGPIHRKYLSNDDLINGLFEKYLEPEKYAFTDFDDISKVTMGDLRASGKRYILNRETPDFKYTVNTPLFGPWTPEVHGMKPRNFMESSLRFFDDVPEICLFNYQSQRTPNFGTEEGIKSPRKLHDAFRPYYKELIDTIANTPELLKKVNIISCDFFTENHLKANYILALNLLKGTVKDELVTEFAKAIEC